MIYSKSQFVKGQFAKGQFDKDSQPLDLSKVVDEYTVLVQRIAHHMRARLPQSICVEDLVQSGMIGLMEAAQKFDGSKGASFETFAGIRIRGAIIDEIRKGEWSPRSVHKNLRQLTTSIRRLEQLHQRPVTDREIAEDLDLSLADYHHMSQDALSVKLFSLQDILFAEGDETQDRIASDEATPYDEVAQAHFLAELSDQIAQLAEKEQLVMSLYYEQEFNLKEVGEVLGVSESRVSQIHAQATLKLRTRLIEWGQTKGDFLG